MRSFRRAVSFACLALVSSVVACSSDATPAEIQDLINSVQVSLGLSQLTVGQTVQAGAIARDASGGALAGVSIAWNSNNPSVASVTPAGMITAVAPGTATITGAVGTHAATANVTVLPVSVASVSVALSATTVAPGQTVTATATTRDGNNNVVTGRSVTWASTNTDVAVISATGAITPVGVGMTIITATSEGMSGTATLAVSGLQVATVTVSLGSSSLAPGASTYATATVRDAANNVLNDRSITWSSSDITVATVTTTGVVTAVTSGTAVITAMSEGVIGTAGVSVQSAVASVVVTLATNPVGLGQTTTATATVRDAGSNVITGRTIVWESSNPTVANVSAAGVVTGVSLGSANISATCEGFAGVATVTVQAAVASVTVTLVSPSVRIGVSTTATAVARDGAGNVLNRPITWTSSAPGTASVTSGGVVTGVALGVASVIATTDGVPGSATISVVDANGSTGSPTATQLAMRTQPAGALSGLALSTPPVVEIRDASNAIVGAANTLVTATITSGSGTITAGGNANAMNGVASFSSLVINGAGPHMLTFSATGLTPVTSAAFNLVQTPAALVIQTQPGGAVSGSPLTSQPVIRIVDNSGTLINTSTLPITAAITTGNGTLLGTNTANAVGGIVTFTNLRIDGSSAQVLTFSTPSPALQVSSNALIVQGGTATQLVLVTPPSGAVSGVNFAMQPVVHVRDAANNTVSGSNAQVTASLASGTGTLVGTTTVTSVNGVAAFTNLRINGSGLHALRFTNNSLTPATSGTLNVTQNAASLSMLAQPGGAVSGTAFTQQPVVQIVDNAGLPVVNASNTVTAVVSSGSGTLAGTSQVNAVNGVATFTNLRITGSGNHILTFSITSPSLSVASAPFGVGSGGAGSATVVVLATAPGGAVSGVNFATQPVLSIRDAAGLVVNTSTAPVTAQITSGSGTLVGTTTINAVNGVAIFSDLRINGSGGHVLTFTSPGLTSAVSSQLIVTQQIALLSIQTQPGGATSGSSLTQQPVVRILDNAGLVVTTANNAVTATRTSGSATINASSTNPVNAVNGVATFTNLRLDGSGSTVLTFSIVGPSLQVVSNAFNVSSTAGPPTQLIVVTQPSAASSGFVIPTQPVVRIADASGITVTSYNGTLTAALGAGSPAGATISGNSVAFSNGSATFTALQVTGPNGAYSLTFTSGSFTVNSASFNLVAPGTLTGTVSGVSGGTVQVLSGSTVVGSATVSGGSYSMSGIGAGTYTARFHPPLAQSVVGGDQSVTITAGNATIQNFSTQPALYADDFQSYTSILQFQRFCTLPSSSTLPGDFFKSAGGDGSCSPVINNVLTQMFLTSIPGPSGAPTKTLEYQWPARTCPNGVLNCSYYVMMGPRLPSGAMSGQSEVWVRLSDQFSSNFRIGGAGASGSQAEYKFLFIDFTYGPGSVDQVTIELDSQQGGAPNGLVQMRLKLVPASGTPTQTDGLCCTNGGLDAPLPANFFGSWNTWVVGVTGLGTASTTLLVYRNNVLLKSITGPFRAAPMGNALVDVQMGANINNGPDQVQSRYWREFAIYKSRPSLLPFQ